MIFTFVILLFLFSVVELLVSTKYSLKNYWWIYIALFILFIPAALYIAQFWKNGFSNDPSMWGVFGDYFGGIYNVLTTILLAYISFRMAKMKNHSEYTVNAAKILLSQISKIKSNNYHHKSVQKLLSIVREHEQHLDDLTKNNIITLADSYTCARQDKTPVNEELEKVVIKQLKKLSNG